jgi:precorrin-6B C5,15-methyltransferase / cobalt-precorrin-6B C5,C15-methyltransferase
MAAVEPTPQGAAHRRWLSIIGIGEDGVEGLAAAARERVQSAAAVFGGARHLALAAPLIRGVQRPWTAPFAAAVAEVLRHRGQPVCVLASGDPFLHGIGSVLARHVARDETVAIPAPSAFSLAAARLLWPLSETTQLSLCGRPLDLVRPHLHPGRRLLLLTAGAHAPAQLADLLCGLGFGASQITVLEALAGPRERVRTARAAAFGLEAVDALNTVALEVAAEGPARVLPRAAGLPDELFEHDGQITRREVRALTLSALAPRRGELLWDIGAGSGSVAIEWLLTDDSLSAMAIERSAVRAARVARNATACGVPQLQVIEGAAPDALAGLPAPDAIFIGGGLTSPGTLERAQQSLRRGGRLVVNSVTLEAESVLLQQHARSGGSLSRFEISHASPLGGAQGRFQGWRPAMPVLQWIWEKDS